eukprot:6613850-Pyramimonas_sp.AAC.1
MTRLLAAPRCADKRARVYVLQSLIACYSCSGPLLFEYSLANDLGGQRPPCSSGRCASQRPGDPPS